MLSAAIAAAVLFAGSPEVDFTCDPGQPCVLDVGFEGKVNDDMPEFLGVVVKLAVEKGATAVLFRIKSEGGDIDAARQAVAMITASPVPFHCWVDEIAASSAAWLLSACQDRIVEPTAIIAVHRPFVSIDVGQVATETALRFVADRLRVVRHEMFSDIARRATRPESDIDTLTAGEGVWKLAGSAAVAAGLADRVATMAELRAELGDARL